MKIYAYVTRSGTAMAETAICEDHIESTAAQALAFGAADQTSRESDPWDRNEVMSDCTGNEALRCQICGAIGGEEHLFTVKVSGCTANQAVQVMAERIDHDEDYGFDYDIEVVS
jgi:hypothetical protein